MHSFWEARAETRAALPVLSVRGITVFAEEISLIAFARTLCVEDPFSCALCKLDRVQITRLFHTIQVFSMHRNYHVCRNINPYADKFFPRITVDPQVENPHGAPSGVPCLDSNYSAACPETLNSLWILTLDLSPSFSSVPSVRALFTSLCIDNEPQKGRQPHGLLSSRANRRIKKLYLLPPSTFTNAISCSRRVPAHNHYYSQPNSRWLSFSLALLINLLISEISKHSISWIF